MRNILYRTVAGAPQAADTFAVTNGFWGTVKIPFLTAAIMGNLALATPASAQSDVCRRLYEDYVKGEAPKAWASGPTGCGYATARSSTTLDEARRRALDACSQGSRECRVVESEG